MRVVVGGAVVGILAARGAFLSVMGFPWIFGAVCVAVGSLSLLGKPRVAVLPRLGMILLAGALAFAGGVGQSRLVERNLALAQQASFDAIADRPAPSLATVAPLNVERKELGEAISYSSKATIVTFWARWCSPCWTELPELNEFYETHKGDGLAVVAVTRHLRQEGDAGRADEFEKAREFVAKYELTFPAAIAPDGEIHQAFAVTALPSAVLIDGDGNVVGYGVGIDGGRAIMEQAKALLASE